MIKGMAAEVTFYKALFDKLGVKADWMQVGKYKSFGEPFTRTSMSPAFREEMTELLGDTYSLLAESIAERKSISVDAAKALIDGGPYSPRKAFEAGIVNLVAYAIASSLRSARIWASRRSRSTPSTARSRKRRTSAAWPAS